MADNQVFGWDDVGYVAEDSFSDFLCFAYLLQYERLIEGEIRWHTRIFPLSM